MSWSRASSESAGSGDVPLWSMSANYHPSGSVVAARVGSIATAGRPLAHARRVHLRHASVASCASSGAGVALGALPRLAQCTPEHIVKHLRGIRDVFGARQARCQLWCSTRCTGLRCSPIAGVRSLRGGLKPLREQSVLQHPSAATSAPLDQRTRASFGRDGLLSSSALLD